MSISPALKIDPSFSSSLPPQPSLPTLHELTTALLVAFIIASAMAFAVHNGHKGPAGASTCRRLLRAVVYITAVALFVIILFSVTGTFDIYFKVRAIATAEDTSLRSGGGIAKFCRDLKALGDEQRAQVVLLITSLYLFLQTFCVPGTVVLNAAIGAVLGTLVGVPYCALLGTLGASSCYLLSKAVGVSLVEAADGRLMKGRGLPAIRSQVNRFREDLFVYMLFLRLTPILPNWLVNLASPVVGVQLPVFAAATFFGIVPQTYLSVRFGAIARTAAAKGKDGEVDKDARIVTPWDTLLLAVIGIAILVAFRLKKKFKPPAGAGGVADADCVDDPLSGRVKPKVTV